MESTIINEGVENISFESIGALKVFPNNKNFNLKLWKSPSQNRKNEIVIMINGFMEGVIKKDQPNPQAFFKRKRKLYEIIATELNQKNINAIHYPLPYHFERSIDISAKELLKINGEFLYNGGFSQVIDDMAILIDDIIENPTKYGLDKNPGIHLIGYSIGGIAAIGTAYEITQRKSDFKFSSLSVLLSAWNLNNIKAENISLAFQNEITVEDWNRLMQDMERVRNNPSVSALYKYLFWEEGEPIRFSEVAHKMLFIHGHNDEIFSVADTHRLQKMVLNEMNRLTIINIPSKHLIHLNSKVLSGYIANFIEGDF